MEAKGNSTPAMRAFVVEVWLPSIQRNRHSWRVDERISRQHILPFFGDLQLDRVSREGILEWLAGLEAGNFAISTRNRILCVLKDIYKLATEKGFLSPGQSPLRGIRGVPEKRQAAPGLSTAQIGLLLDRLAAENRPEATAIALLLLTGAAKNEILTARWDHLDIEKKILFTRAQSGRERAIALNDRALAVIAALPRVGDSPWLFPARNRERPLTHIFPFWNSIRRECGLGSFRIQDLRHALDARAPRVGMGAISEYASPQGTPQASEPGNPSRINSRNVPIAIIGMGMRFPGGVRDEASMWETLMAKKCRISRIPENRWPVDALEHPSRPEPGRSVTFAAGVLDDIDAFDASFFKISPREAAWMDPQQRLLLEMAHEAMEDAGIVPEELAGAPCAVYVGISGMDYGQHALEDLASMTGHSMTGNTLSIAANRLSYFYDLRGPSLAMDTACSSALAAIHQACQALRDGEAPIALAGGVNLLMHPYSFIGFSHASMLSATGSCRPFDAAGDGYVRGEGGALLLLKPLNAALRDGDPVHAVIMGSGVNSDGARKSGLTIPSAEAQTDLMREVLTFSGMEKGDLDFVEAHGTGTPVGDPVEAASIGHAYGQGAEKPLPISSSKANFGHLEPASGMVGLIKAVLTLKHGYLPPMPLDFTPNPNIDFGGLNIFCAANGLTLTRRDGKPLAGAVNSFGFGGLNAHVLLRAFEAPANQTGNAAISGDHQDPPLILSARDEEALKELALAWANRLEGGDNYYDLAWNAAYHRSRMEKRLAVWLDDPSARVEALRAHAKGTGARGLVTETAPREAGGIALIYTGNGAQWHGMGRALFAESSVFAKALTTLDAQMRPLFGYSILEKILRGERKDLEDTTVCQPMIFAIQIGVTAVLRSMGIKADAVAGHSVGEVAAAWAAGALSTPQAIKVIHARSLAQGKTFGMGKMAAVALSAGEAAEIIADMGLEGTLEVAAANSPANCTISGDTEALRAFQERIKKKNIFFRMLDLEYAFHSRHMEKVRGDLEEMLADLTPAAESDAIFVSTVTGSQMAGAFLDRHYWWRNMREPVNFAGAITELFQLGMRVFVEIGPHAVLQRYMRESLGDAMARCRIMPSSQKGNPGLERLRNLGASLHLLGSPGGLHALFPREGRRLRLPLYPWRKQSCWYRRTSEGMPQMRRTQPLLGWELPGVDQVWENLFDPRKDLWLADHQVGGVVVFPAAAYVEMALEAGRAWLGGTAVALENLDIRVPMVFERGKAQSVRCTVNSGDGVLRIISRPRLGEGQWTEHARCRLIAPASGTLHPGAWEPASTGGEMDGAHLYALANGLGLDYGDFFRRVETLRHGDGRIEATLRRVNDGGYVIDPGVMDACFHSLAALYAGGKTGPYLPVGAGRIEAVASGQPTHIRASLRKNPSRVLRADFEILDSENNLLARALDCRFRLAPSLASGNEPIDCWTITPWLTPLPEATPAPIPDNETLTRAALAALEPLASERTLWFKEVLPRLEAVAAAGMAEIQDAIGERFPKTGANPYFTWMGALLRNGGLLPEEESQRGAGQLPSWLDLWREAYLLAPRFLPALLPVARVLRRLPELARGEISGVELAREIHTDAIADVNSPANPAFAGINLAVKAMIDEIAAHWPHARRLCLLELGAAPDSLAEILAARLSEAGYEHLVVDPDKKSPRQNGAGIESVAADPIQWLLEQPREPEKHFDVAVLRHVLHKGASLIPIIEKIRGLLNPGGLLILCERHADWSADLVDGLDHAWWQMPEGNTPLSSRMPPEAWRGLLAEHGFSECVTFTEPAADGLEEGAYIVLGRESGAMATVPDRPGDGSWLILCDTASRVLAEATAAWLKELGRQAYLAPGDCADDFQADNILFMRGHSDEPTDTLATLADLLSRARAVADAARPVHLWLITRGGALATTPPAEYEPRPAQATLTGLGRVIQNEFPDLRCRLVDLDQKFSPEDAARALTAELAAHDNEDEILLAPGARFAMKIRSMPKNPAGATPYFRLDFSQPGRLDNLFWRGELESAPPRADEVEARVMAVGLNFRDIMLTMGLLPEDALEKGFAGPTLGLEFAGVVTRVGANVSTPAVGDRVAGFAPACFASHVRAPARAVAVLPPELDFTRAATAPTIFITAWYALKHLAKLEAGETVLIHGGAGGVGIAAIQIAKMIGARVFATAGSPEKRDFLRCLGVDAIFDSRSLDFADEILAVTNGEGVDVALNSLAGEAMRRTMAILKPFGRFLELGKRDYVENTSVGLRPLKENISYFSIDVDQLLTAKPETASHLFGEVMDYLRQGRLSPPPHMTYPASRVIAAFRAMQQSRHMGKIVVDMTIPPPVAAPRVDPTPDYSGTWLVSGGMGGVGLATARFLAKNGVKSLVLAGRRGNATPEAPAIAREFEEAGVKLLIASCDFCDREAVAALVGSIGMEMEPLTGIVHTAAVFDDRLMRDLDSAALETALNAKFLGAWNLHLACADLPLRHFILYSSISVALGNPGQGNYVAANAGLESLALWRRARGLPATCVAWGPIGDVGYLARHENVRKSLAGRLGREPLTSEQAMSQFGEAAMRDGARILANVDWSRALRFYELPPSRFSFLETGGGAAEGAPDSASLRDQLQGMSLAEAASALKQCIVEEASRVLGLDATRLPPDSSLQALGLDSLMAMELALGLEHRTGLHLPPMLLQDAPTVNQLARRIAERLLGDEGDLGGNDAVLADLARRHSEELAPEVARDLLNAVAEENQQ